MNEITEDLRRKYITVSANELRSLIREKGLRGSITTSIKRNEMINYLESGIIPERLSGMTDKAQPTQPDNAALANTIATAVAAALGNGAEDGRVDSLIATVDELSDRVESLVHAEPTRLAVKVAKLPEVEIDNQHSAFKDVLTMAANGLNVFLYGPAGTGKTSLAKAVAKAMGLPCYCQSVCAQSSLTMLSGYQDASGNYVRSQFRRAYEQGGVYCLDEVDNGNPNTMAWLNTAIDNGECTFPDAVVRRHDSFICIATGNTNGNGPTKDFVGRNPLDGATLDRFNRVFIGRDANVERAMAMGNDDWYELVQQYRKRFSDSGLRQQITSRKIRDGAKMLAAGMALNTVLEICIFAGLSDADKARIV